MIPRSEDPRDLTTPARLATRFGVRPWFVRLAILAGLPRIWRRGPRVQAADFEALLDRAAAAGEADRAREEPQ